MSIFYQLSLFEALFHYSLYRTMTSEDIWTINEYNESKEGTIAKMPKIAEIAKLL